MRITNTILAQKTGLPLSKIRRWSKEFLPPDPRAKRQSGYAREMNIDEAWQVYLGGMLVSEYGLGFSEARQALDAVWPFLKEYNLMPSEYCSNPRKGSKAAYGLVDYRVTFKLDKNNRIDNCLLVEGDTITDNGKMIKDPKRGLVARIPKITEQFTYNFGEDRHSLEFNDFPRCRKFPVEDHFSIFLDGFRD
jgi:hypothetical protein